MKHRQRTTRRQSVKARRDKFFRPLLETLEERHLLSYLPVVVDIEPGTSGSDPQSFTDVSSHSTLFTADTSDYGRELWKTDGTSAGTVLLKDIYSGQTGSNPGEFSKAGDHVYFVADDGSSIKQIWKSDGSTAGTVRVTNFTTGGHPHYLTAFGENVFFKRDDGTTGIEPWITDGTEAGTVLIKDLVPGGFGSNPESIVTWNNQIYFAAQAAAGQERRLWESDGTTEGTLNLGSPASGNLVSTSEGVFFTRSAGTDEVYHYDGQTTTQINTGNVTSIDSLVVANDTVFSNGQNSADGLGNELYRVNTSNNTLELVKDIQLAPDRHVRADRFLFTPANPAADRECVFQ